MAHSAIVVKNNDLVIRDDALEFLLREIDHVLQSSLWIRSENDWLRNAVRGWLEHVDEMPPGAIRILLSDSISDKDRARTFVDILESVRLQVEGKPIAALLRIKELQALLA